MQFDFIRNIEKASPVREPQIIAVERAFNIRFPEVLREYYMKANGCYTRNFSLDLEAFIYEVNCVLPIAGPPLTVEKLKRRIMDNPDIPASFFPIAVDYGSGIYFWDSLTGEVWYVRDTDGTRPNRLFSSVDEMFMAMNEAVTKGEYRRNETMSKIDYAPLGSVVVLNGGTQRLIIVGRGLNVESEGETYYFDYGAAMYPQGLIGDQLAYFNHDAIARVFFEGYRDDENEIVNQRLNDYVAEHPDLKRRSFEE